MSTKYVMYLTCLVSIYYFILLVLTFGSLQMTNMLFLLFGSKGWLIPSIFVILSPLSSLHLCYCLISVIGFSVWLRIFSISWQIAKMWCKQTDGSRSYCLIRIFIWTSCITIKIAPGFVDNFYLFWPFEGIKQFGPN